MLSLFSNKKTLFSGLAIIFIAIGCAISTGSDLYKADKSKTWPSTKGTIEHIGSALRSSQQVQSVTYVYKVNNITYHSNDIGAGGPRFDVPGVKKFAVDEAVDVFYNPEDPAQSLLYPGISGESVQVFIGWGFIIVFCLALGGSSVFMYWRSTP